MADHRRVELWKSRVMLLWLVCSLFSLSLGQAIRDENVHVAANAVDGIGKPAHALKQHVREYVAQPRSQNRRDLQNPTAIPNHVGGPQPGNNPRFNPVNQQWKPQGQPIVVANNELRPNVQAAPAPAQPQGGLRKSTTIKLADHQACRNDVKTYCSSATNNFAVLDCLQNDLKSDQDISTECQHIVWNYKRNLTTDLRFESAAKEVCKDELNKFTECKAVDGGVGHVIPCLIDYKPNITIPNCRTFLTKMASIVFGDFRLIYNLVQACDADIAKTTCGRLHEEHDDSPHSQGRTVECLSTHVKDLDSKCKHEILRIAELQADDYHLDRPLFYACREDRERLCARTKAGNGKVYKCLMRHKFDREMSSECRSKLTQRQKLMQSNYKVNKGLAQACQRDIAQYKCIHDTDPGFKQARLSKVVLCLEDVQKEGKQVEEDCIIELKEVRKSLMADYKISPEIVTSCATDINDHCGKGIQREGKTLHCLMDLARPKPDGQGKMVITLEPTCQAELQKLLKEVDVGTDWTLDPVLHAACQPIVQVHCKDIKQGEGLVLSCLMEHLDSKVMNADCEERLMEIHYFLARDFGLDYRLYKSCHKNAEEMCGASSKWHESKKPEQRQLTFACLYRHLKFRKNQPGSQLSRACAFEVRRVMRQRAVSVQLEPRIEEPCLGDLGAFCSDNVDRKEEMRCLQDNYKELSEECQFAVGNFTQDEDIDPNMDRILMKSCSPMIKNFCERELEKDADPGDVMECLIKHKDDASMDEKCAAGILHHQLITMKDYHFSVKFKESCKEDVLENCKGVRQKAEVVECLSEKVRNAVLEGKRHAVSKKCRKQLSFELLQRSEDIKLDPKLQDRCQMDVKKFCANLTPGRSNVVDCLRKHEKGLSDKCRGYLFKREVDTAVDVTTDFLLMHACKQMIKKHCMNIEPSKLFHCLVEKKQDDDFDHKCKKVVIERMRQKNTNINLNPNLLNACRKDIFTYCKDEFKPDSGTGDNEGRVIQCLKVKFAQTHRLSETCQSHMRGLIKEVARDYQQDPKLAQACKNEIDQFCEEAKAADEDADGGKVIDCLKLALSTAKITVMKNMMCVKEVARVLAEDRADIQVDPLLYRECALDIKHLCFDVPRGEGRQMSCMLAALDNKKIHLRPTCEKMLTERVKMWEMAAKVAPPDTFQQLYIQVTTSEARNYFLGIIFAVIGFIFIGGLMCGRVTKRMRAEMKNR